MVVLVVTVSAAGKLDFCCLGLHVCVCMFPYIASPLISEQSGSRPLGFSPQCCVWGESGCMKVYIKIVCLSESVYFFVCVNGKHLLREVKQLFVFYVSSLLLADVLLFIYLDPL